MAAPTYKARGIVLRKTRLSESDLIVELIDDEGKKLKLVAKGARKPASRLSAHLELFNTCEVLCVKGKNLDIVKESRLVSSRSQLMSDPVKNAAACSVVELISAIIQTSLKQPRLFEMTDAALDAIDTKDVSATDILLAADIIKTVSLTGLRPMLLSCAICGAPEIEQDELALSVSLLAAKARDIRISHIEGGIICADCAKLVESAWVPRSSIILAQHLLMSRFSDIASFKVEDATVFELLQILHLWVGVHIGTKLKSLGPFFDLRYIRT